MDNIHARAGIVKCDKERGVKRDLDLIRQILLEVEKNENPIRSIEIRVEGFSPEQVSYHVMLLNQAGYLTATDNSSLRGFSWYPKSLTWEGHEFLDAARSGTVWHQVKAKLKDQAIEAPLSVIHRLASKLVAQALGLND
jgi:hypothetical protein